MWYGGGKLAADLTLPKLRRRWRNADHGAGTAPGGPLSWAERDAIWQHAARAAATAADQIRCLTATDPAAAADAAWAASDTLHVAAAVLRSREIRQAADAYDRAARAPYGRVPRPTPAGDSLRHMARLLSAAAYLTHDPALTAIALVARLAAVAEAVADLRRAQQHAAQAAAPRPRHAARFLAGCPAQAWPSGAARAAGPPPVTASGSRSGAKIEGVRHGSRHLP